ncbi:universal stress protein [Halovenus sp. WSH3]|uniref:Universal stress protein n=1 Tax=Halovenus carboxidivorans TaxID=2692199 RepID=A0A6B0T612_9EURY|nr:universal stress protein [Halovenus carboxidivorans]MXR51626.1 universal stress protein [Halovenus carboxidivorans]
MYETVLVPVDGSDESRTAAAEAVELTASEGMLHALAVIEELPMHRRSGKAEKFDRGGDRSEAEEAIAAVADRAETADVDYETTITEGAPSREISSYAEAVDADAIVVGKRGASESAGEILGSTTERVLKNAPTTVVAVPS